MINGIELDLIITLLTQINFILIKKSLFLRLPQQKYMEFQIVNDQTQQKIEFNSNPVTKKNKNKHYFNKQFSYDSFNIQKASTIVNDVTDLLYEEIQQGIIQFQNNQEPYHLNINNNSTYKQKLPSNHLDYEEHRRKVKQYMKANKKFLQKLKNRTLQFQNSLKTFKEQQKQNQQQKKLTQRQRRKSLIQRRMSQKSQMMAKIRQMSIQSQQRFKMVKNKKFLFEQKQEQFKEKVILPKIQQQKKILQNRKQKMKPMDLNSLKQHEKNYYQHKKNQQINRSVTSRILKSSTVYNPPQFVPKSYQIYQAEEELKKQKEIMKAKQSEKNKEKVKQYTKKLTQMHKLQNQISRTLSVSPKSNTNEKNSTKQKSHSKRKGLSKKQIDEKGNSYFQALLSEIRAAKQKRQKRAKQKQQMQKSLIKQETFKQNDSDGFQIQIRSQQIKTVEKIEKIERIFKVRYKKIEKIFNDKHIDPITKYEKLKHQVQNLQMGLKTKKIQSQNIEDRTEAAGCYLNVIKAKLKLLQAQGSI